MPPEETWQGFFSPEHTLRKLGLTSNMQLVVDFGCGYGTFSIPAAQLVQGRVLGLDIEAGMVAATRQKATACNLLNLDVRLRDFVSEGAGLADAQADFVMLLNILHAEHPDVLLREAWRILRDGGILAVMHWNYDAGTPRGPSMDIRPRPDQIIAWAKKPGFRPNSETPVDLPPFHYGLTFEKICSTS